MFISLLKSIGSSAFACPFVFISPHPPFFFSFGRHFLLRKPQCPFHWSNLVVDDCLARCRHYSTGVVGKWATLCYLSVANRDAQPTARAAPNPVRADGALGRPEDERGFPSCCIAAGFSPLTTCTLMETGSALAGSQV